MMRWLHWIVLIPFLVPPSTSYGRQMFSDHSHFSKVFGEPRNYRILLPPDYETSGRAYPVIYYFHGHSDRYTLEGYDQGTDTLPKMIDFVSKHDVIVVAVDGFVGRDYTGFYGGSPWDIRRDGGDFDFGSYFQELVAHIDSTYRTWTDRRHRATAGLSMGGFMSLYLSARYPDLIGSASAFNPAPEFFTGEKGRRSLWRSKDHVAGHGHSMVRLVRGSGDYISQYHEETRDAYARADEVGFEYRQDEYHRHWATSIAETFEFHMRAFANPKLNKTPVVWTYANAYKSFEVWGYRVSTSSNEPGYTYLEDVTQGGLQVATRRWAPDGPSLPGCRITITSAPIYTAGKSYAVLDYSLKDGTVSKEEVKADAEGRITWTVDGEGHRLSFLGPGSEAHAPVLLPLTTKDRLKCLSQEEISLPIRIYNPRGEPMTHIKLALSSEYPTVQILKESHEIANMDSGTVADVSTDLRVRFVAGGGYFAATRLRLNMTYDGWYEVVKNIDLLVIPEGIPAPVAVEVLDGRTMTFPVFRQKGNQGGGAAVERRVTEGKGNANGILEPGEEATIWVKMAQGMDPFDKNNWYRCKVYSDSPWVTEIADIQEEKQREWTGAQERTSLIRLSPQTLAGAQISLLLDNESWSFHYTPDVRYGREKLYQAFQLHTHHLHRYELRVP